MRFSPLPYLCGERDDNGVVPDGACYSRILCRPEIVMSMLRSVIQGISADTEVRDETRTNSSLLLRFAEGKATNWDHVLTTDLTEKEITTYAVTAEKDAIVRYDFAFWGYNITTASLIEHMESVFACVAVRSSVGCAKVDYSTFLAVIAPTIRDAFPEARGGDEHLSGGRRQNRYPGRRG
jgi:hypothetical protein